MNRSLPDCAVIPELAYADVKQAVAWLCENFGFTLRMEIGNHRAQLVFGNGALVVIEGAAGAEVGHTHGMLVRVADIEAHYTRVIKAGVKILRPLADQPYGERQYTVEDVGGHVWTFSQTVADVDPAAWGGVWHQRGSE